MIVPIRSGPVQRIRPGCHYKIVAVQPFDHVSPPRDRDFSPFREQRRVVIFSFRKFSDTVGKRQRRLKIREFEDTLQLPNVIVFDDEPFRDLR